MLCSECNKNNAVVFINKQDDKGNSSMEGLCYECAKKRGINPIDTIMKQANISENDLNNMTKQFEEMFKDMSENMDLSEMSEALSNPDSEDDDNLEDEQSSGMQFGAIPLGSIFSNMFGTGTDETDSTSSGSEKKKVKVDKKNKKRYRSRKGTVL